MNTQSEYVGNQSLQEAFEAVLTALLRSEVIQVDIDKCNASPPNLEDSVTKND